VRGEKEYDGFRQQETWIGTPVAIVTWVIWIGKLGGGYSVWK
jgi:hypothetical protein